MGDGREAGDWQTNRHTASVAEEVTDQKGKFQMAATFAPLAPVGVSKITSPKKRRTERRRDKRERRKDRRDN